MLCRLLVAPLLLTLALPAAAGSWGEQWDALPKERKLLYTNVGMAAFITLWGVTQWDYFQSSPKTSSEGWFGQNTSEGGADKLGHAYTSHLLANILASKYHKWGYETEQAGLYGALSAFGVQAFMEVGDSFSGKYGFSYEDFIANGVGALYGYYYWRYPALAEKVDFRIEYAPTFENGDVFTDYEHHKYLLAFKFSGVDRIKDTPLRFLELHGGYYVRGYDDRIAANERRQLYVGIGLNLSELAESASLPRLSTFFKFYQTPYTYVSTRHRLGD